jgi:hypothetical protein
MKIQRAVEAENHGAFLNAGNVAIVGSSGGLTGTAYGSVIDTHDTVVRFNAAPTEGFEKDVGSETDMRFMNVAMQRGHSLAHVTNTPKRYIRQVRSQGLVLKYSGKSIQRRAQEAIHESCDVYKITKYRKAYYKHSLRWALGPDFNTNFGGFSSGLNALLLFLPHADQISLFGFGFYQEDLKNLHYWEDFEADVRGPHNYEREKTIVQKLVDQTDKLAVYK